MTIFILLFIIIVAISAYLAYLSMKDFYEIPEKGQYGLFLIRNPAALTVESINKLQSLAMGQMVSFERLFKGSESAVVLYAPRELVGQFPEFKFLEIEDYSKEKRHSSNELWRQFVTQIGSDLKVESRILDPKQKDLETLSDYRKRKIAPLGKSTKSLSAKELLEAILLPR